MLQGTVFLMLVIEIEEELCKKARELCASYQITLEELLEQFIDFASNTENLPELKTFLDINSAVQKE